MTIGFGNINTVYTFLATNLYETESTENDRIEAKSERTACDV